MVAATTAFDTTLAGNSGIKRSVDDADRRAGQCRQRRRSASPTSWR